MVKFINNAEIKQSKNKAKNKNYKIMIANADELCIEESHRFSTKRISPTEA